MKLYGAFTKVEEQDDGTIMVEGIASTESVDCDGEIVKASAIEAALPDYMRHGSGALREMHQPQAAGTATASVLDGVTTIKAHVVDPVAVKKVKTETYKGFSIGGHVTERDSIDKNTITGLRLVEISLVDRPANPDAVLTMWKAEGVEDDTGEAAQGEGDAAAPDGLEKGLQQVAWLADLLSSLKALQESAEWESQIEADGSAIPAQIKDAVSTLADLLVAMTAEETAELQSASGDVDVVDADDDVAMADATGDLAKVDAADELTKLAASIPDLIAKAVKPLQDELDALKAMPAPAKAVISTIAKADDAGQPTIEKVDPVLNPDGSVNIAATELKKLHRAGGVITA